MEEYCKIQTIFKRDPSTKHKSIVEGDYTLPIFEYLSNNRWIFTEKIDGTNIRVKFKDGRVELGGRTDDSHIPSFLVNKLYDMFPVDKMLQVFSCSDVCLYGEGFGAKIQKGGGNYIPNGCSFILFDIKIDGWWLERKKIEDIASSLGIDIVPIIGEGTLSDAVEMTRNGFQSTIGKCIAEGIVLKPKVEMFDRAGRRVIAKIKYRDFVKKS